MHSAIPTKRMPSMNEGLWRTEEHMSKLAACMMQLSSVAALVQKPCAMQVVIGRVCHLAQHGGFAAHVGPGEQHEGRLVTPQGHIIGYEAAR